MTPQLAHVSLPMPWVQISLQCRESCKNKTTMHTTSRMYKDWGQRLRTSCSICPVVSATEHRESCLSCTSLVYWWGLIYKRWLIQQQIQPHLGRRESACSVHQSSPGEIQCKHMGWNSWRLSAGTCQNCRPFEWGRLPGIPPEHASAAHRGDTLCDTQRNVVPTWWRSSALQPASTITSEQSLQEEMDRERGACCMVRKTRPDWAIIHCVWSNQTESWHVRQTLTGNGTTT